MSSKSISVRIQPNSGRKGAGQRKHDLRDPSATPEYVDTSRGHLNSIIIEPPTAEAVRAEISANRLAAGQKKLQADARTTIAGILTFGVDAQPIIENLSKTDQNALFKRIAQRVAREASRPLLGLVVHRDESAIHAHFTLRGYELKNGRENAPRFTPSDLKRLQDTVAAEVADLGIERGTPKAERIKRGESRAQTVHRTVAELHNDLPKERAAAEAAIIEAHDKRRYYEGLRDKAREQLKAEGADADRLEKRIATYEARITKLDEVAKQSAPDQPIKTVEPMQRMRADVVMSSNLFGKKSTEEHIIVTDAEARRFEKQTAERERALLDELAQAKKTLSSPLVKMALDTQERSLRELHETMLSTKSRTAQIARDYGLGD